VGNFFASAIAEDCLVQECSRAQLVQALHAAVHRCVSVGNAGWRGGGVGMTWESACRVTQARKEGTNASQKLVPLWTEENWKTGRRCNRNLSAMHSLQFMRVQMPQLGVHDLAHACLPPCRLFMTLHMDNR
jgi:hypothetical protein